MHTRELFAYLLEGHSSLQVLTSSTLGEAHSVQLLANRSLQLRQSGWRAVQTVDSANVDDGHELTQT